MSRHLNSDDTSFSLKDISSLTALLTYTATQDYLIGARVDFSSLNSAASEITVVVKITNTFGVVSEAYRETVSKSSGQTTLSHNLNKALVVNEGEVVSTYGLSSNSSDVSISGSVYYIGAKAVIESEVFSKEDLTAEASLASYTPSLGYKVFVRVDFGSGVYLLDSAESELTCKAKIGSSSVLTYSKTVTKQDGDTSFIHCFDKDIYVESGSELQVLAESTGDDTEISGTVYFALVGITAKSEIIDWLKTEFLPLTLVTPDDTISQLIDNSIRYWNTHSGHKISAVYDFAYGTKRIQLAPEFKSVVEVHPTSAAEYLWNDHPLWSLLGITVLDNVTSDLILVSEAFKNYRQYIGTNMRWWFERSMDPAIGGYLYISNLPNTVAGVFVVGTRRITDIDAISDDYILDWIMYYTKALLKQCEGNTLRKSSLAGIPNDGQELVDEGKEEAEKMRERLKKNGRWVVLAKRF